LLQTRWLVDSAPSQERALIETEELDDRRSALREALIVLDERERRIFEARHLADEPVTLEDLPKELGVSRERVRQAEVRSFEKVRNSVQRRVAAMEGSQAPTAYQPRPFSRGARPQRTPRSTTYLRAPLSQVSPVAAAA
jgi:RNA polymerase sigma-32 factor